MGRAGGGSGEEKAKEEADRTAKGIEEEKEVIHFHGV